MLTAKTITQEAEKIHKTFEALCQSPDVSVGVQKFFQKTKLLVVFVPTEKLKIYRKIFKRKFFSKTKTTLSSMIWMQNKANQICKHNYLILLQNCLKKWQTKKILVFLFEDKNQYENLSITSFN